MPTQYLRRDTPKVILFRRAIKSRRWSGKRRNTSVGSSKSPHHIAPPKLSISYHNKVNLTRFEYESR